MAPEAQHDVWSLFPAVMGLVGALIGVLGSSLTTIYITRRQGSDQIRRQVWESRRISASQVHAKARALALALHGAAQAIQLAENDPEALDLVAGEVMKLNEAKADLLRACDDNVLVLPASMIAIIDNYSEQSASLALSYRLRTADGFVAYLAAIQPLTEQFCQSLFSTSRKALSVGEL